MTQLLEKVFAKAGKLPEVEKNAFEKGKYLMPELFGAPASLGIDAPEKSRDEKR